MMKVATAPLQLYTVIAHDTKRELLSILGKKWKRYGGIFLDDECPLGPHA